MSSRRIGDAARRDLGVLFRVGTLGGESDGALLDRFLEGQEASAEAAFATLVERHGPMVLGVARRMLDDPNDAEDVAQASFLLLARKARSIRARESVASWLFGVAVRVARKARAKASRERRAVREFAEDRGRASAVAPTPSGPESPWADLYAALDRLPESLRGPLVLCYLEGLTNEQASDRLGVPLRTLRRRLARGKERLRSRLAPGSDSAAGLAPLLASLSELARPPMLPIPLAVRTVRSALAFAAGRDVLAGSSSAAAVTIAQEVLRAMSSAKLASLAVASVSLVLAGALTVAAVPIVRGMAGGDGPPAEVVGLEPDQEPEDDAPAPAPSLAEVPDNPIPGGFDRPPVPDWAIARPRTGPGTETTVRIVSAETGEPIPGAAARIWIAQDSEWRTADERGELLIAHSTGPADSGSFGVDVWGDGFAMQRHTFWTRIGDPDAVVPEEVMISLHPGESLGGIVRNEQGEPIAGATISLWSHNYQKTDPNELLYDLRATTGPDGRWRTGGAPRTTGELLGIQVIHPDYLSDRTYNTQGEKPSIEELRAGTAVSVMKTGPRVEGVVRDADGAPVAGAMVLTADRLDGLFQDFNDFAVTTDAEGRFRTGQIAPGRFGPWHLVAQAPGHAPEGRAVEPGEEGVELQLSRPRPFRLRVVDEQGEPISGAFVNIDRWRRYRFLGVHRWTDAEGRVTWDEAPDESFLVNVSDEGYFPIFQEPIEPTDEEVVLTMSRGLSISGMVRDAESKARIESATVEVGLVDPETGEVLGWRSKPDDVANQWWVDNGRLDVRFPVDDEGSAYRIRISAIGFEPFVSRIFRAEERSVSDYEVVLEPPGPEAPRFVVRMPDGEPLADAPVLIGTRERGITAILNGKPVDPSGEVDEDFTPRTAPDGSFPVPVGNQPMIAVVLGERGYAIIGVDELVGGREIEAKPFARVEGRYLIGNASAEGKTITLSGIIQNDSTGRIALHPDHTATTGPAGGFTFERVIPAEQDFRIGRQDPRDAPGRVSTRGQLIRVEPGETARVLLGGQGQAVVGRVVLPEGWDRPIDFSRQVTARVDRDEPQTPYPPGLFRGKTDLQAAGWLEWRETWQSSPEGIAYGADFNWSTVELDGDGSFRIDDVPPGRYRLVVQLNNLVPLEPPPFAPISRTFTVPDNAGEGPIDFGTMTLRPRTNLEVGKRAPRVEVTTTGGERLTLPDDFHGRFLVLDFGTTSDDQSRLQIARTNGLHSRFDDEDRVAFVSLLISANAQEAQAFIDEKGQAWPQVILDSFEHPVALAFGIEDDQRSIGTRVVLIGPEGDVLARDIYGRATEEMLAEALQD